MTTGPASPKTLLVAASDEHPPPENADAADLGRARHRNDTKSDNEDDRSTARDYYVRLWPTEILLAASSLRPESFVAWAKLLAFYARQHGELPDDNVVLARYAGLSIARWRKVRVELFHAGLAGQHHGRWVDKSQDQSIELQRRAAERGRHAAQTRWDKRRA